MDKTGELLLDLLNNIMEGDNGLGFNLVLLLTYINILKLGAILGFAFKADTNDTRESPAIRICRDLLEEGAQLAIHDPKVTAQQIARDLQQEASPQSDALSGTGSWAEAGRVEDAVTGADAVLVLTEWQHYKVLNWMALAALMRKPAWLFDARAVTDSEQVRAAGLTLWRVGDGEG